MAAGVAGGGRVGLGAEPVVRRGVHHAPIRLAEVGLGRPLDPLDPGTPLLGDDLDHAAGGFGPVERRRGRTLDDLEALDVLRVDGVQRARRLHRPVAGARDSGEGGLDADTVHVDHRVEPRVQRARPTDPDLRSGPGFAAVLHEGQPRRTGRQQLRHVVDGGHFRDLVRTDAGHRVPDGPLLRPARRPRHHQLFQVDGLLAQGEVGYRHLPRRYRHVHRLVPEADDLGLDRVGAYRHVQDQVLAAGVGQSAALGAQQADLGSGQRTLRRRVRDLAPDRPGGLGRQGHDTGHDKGQRRKQPHGSTTNFPKGHHSPPANRGGGFGSPEPGGAPGAPRGCSAREAGRALPPRSRRFRRGSFMKRTSLFPIHLLSLEGCGPAPHSRREESPQKNPSDSCPSGANRTGYGGLRGDRSLAAYFGFIAALWRAGSFVLEYELTVNGVLTLLPPATPR